MWRCSPIRRTSTLPLSIRPRLGSLGHNSLLPNRLLKRSTQGSAWPGKVCALGFLGFSIANDILPPDSPSPANGAAEPSIQTTALVFPQELHSEQLRLLHSNIILGAQQANSSRRRCHWPLLRYILLPMDRCKIGGTGRPRPLRPDPTELHQLSGKHQRRTLVGADQQLVRPWQPATSGLQHDGLVGIRERFCRNVRSTLVRGTVDVFRGLLFGSSNILAAHAGKIA